MHYFIFPLLAIFFGACSVSPQPKRVAPKKPVILVSVAPYKKIVEQIAQDKVEVVCVIPPHIDPHNWEPTYRDVSLFQEAKAWFTIGEKFEPRLIAKLHDTNKSIIEISLASLVRKELHGEHPQDMVNLSYTYGDHNDHLCHHHDLDPHFWLDPLLNIIQARVIRETLSNLFPEETDFFTENFLTLKDKLLTLDETLQEALSLYKGKILVTSHGAYTYYCFRYGLYQLSIEPSSGKEPRAQEIGALIARIKEQKDKIVAIILQPQHTNKAAKVLATNFNLPLSLIDPYAEDYEETLSSLTEVITKGPT